LDRAIQFKRKLNPARGIPCPYSAKLSLDRFPLATRSCLVQDVLPELRVRVLSRTDGRHSERLILREITAFVAVDLFALV
jgi:hypothetical protein